MAAVEHDYLIVTWYLVPDSAYWYSSCCCSQINSHNQVRGQRTGSSHSGVEEYPRKKTQTKPKVLHAYIVAEAIHPCLREKNIKVKSGVSLQFARSVLVHASHYSRLKKPTTRLATQKRLPRIYCTWYPSLRIRTSDSSQLEEENKRKGKKAKK